MTRTGRPGKYDQIDRAALREALLALRTCPHCRRELIPVALLADVYGCSACAETWYLPQETDPNAN